jgi:hypothetical protein
VVAASACSAVNLYPVGYDFVTGNLVWANQTNTVLTLMTSNQMAQAGAASTLQSVLDVGNSATNNLSLTNQTSTITVGKDVAGASGSALVKIMGAKDTPAIQIGNYAASLYPEIQLRGTYTSAGRYGLMYDNGNDATFLYGYAGRKLILGERAFAGGLTAAFTFDFGGDVNTNTLVGVLRVNGQILSNSNRVLTVVDRGAAFSSVTNPVTYALTTSYLIFTNWVPYTVTNGFSSTVSNITVHYTGLCRVGYQISGDGEAESPHYEAEVFKDGINVEEISSETDSATAITTSMSAEGVLNVSSGAVFSVRLKSTPAKNLTILKAQFVVNTL